MSSALPAWLSRWADPAAAVTLAAATAAVGHRYWSQSRPDVFDVLCGVGSCLVVATRRRVPLTAAWTLAVLTAAPLLNPASGPIFDGPTGYPPLAAVFLISLALGSQVSWLRSLTGLAPLGIGVALTGGQFNPFLLLIVVGPWLIGLVLASRQHAADLLARRMRELNEERETFAAASVRYERARIARDLHDIVAHNVSLLVVQANAGAYLVDHEPAAAAAALAAIDAAGRQARIEVDRLASVLNDHDAYPSADLHDVNTVIETARQSGLRVRYKLQGEPSQLTPAATDVAHRVIREALTNSVKHAPGAEVDITVESGSDDTIIQVRNGPPNDHDHGLGTLGAGHGLAGMRERIQRLGGLLDAGPDGLGGWLVSARIPRHIGASTS